LCVSATEHVRLIGGQQQQKAITCTLVCLSSSQWASRQAASHGSRSAVLLFSPLILIYIGAICSKQSFYIMPALQSAIAC